VVMPQSDPVGNGPDDSHVVAGQVALRLEDQRLQPRHGVTVMPRPRVAGGQRLEQLRPPGLLVGPLDFVDRRNAVEVATDRRSNPARLAGNKHLHAVAPCTGAGFRELHMIEEDKYIAARNLVEITHPREKIRLMNCNDPKNLHPIPQRDQKQPRSTKH